MDKRNIFVNYIKNGGEKFCSPQIGAGAGFDSKLAGKEWISETTLEDTLAAVKKFDIIPLVNIGCPYEICVPQIVWEEKLIEKQEDRIVKEYFLSTPSGMLLRKTCEVKRSSPFNVKYPVTCEDDLDPFEYYINELMESDFTQVMNYTHDVVAKIDGSAALSVQWPVQPYELLCFPNTVDTVLLAADCPDRFKSLMDRIVKIDDKLMEAVSKGGADFIFLGAPSTEMLSPAYYENYIIPYSKIVTSIAHSYGLLVYSHICSPIEPFLTMGFYNRMGIDLFETLSPPPVGNVASLEDALRKLDTGICTRGNLGLDVLLGSSRDEVKRKTYEILEATEGRKHIVAASDYLFYETPVENVHAMAEAVSSSFMFGNFGNKGVETIQSMVGIYRHRQGINNG